MSILLVCVFCLFLVAFKPNFGRRVSNESVAPQQCRRDLLQAKTVRYDAFFFWGGRHFSRRRLGANLLAARLGAFTAVVAANVLVRGAGLRGYSRPI